MLPGLRTPRIVMQECVASITTATPLASSSSTSRLAIVSVIRSCTCGRCETTSTTRASLLSPTTRAVRHVADVGHAHERQHVMLAHAVEADVADQHHFVVLLGEELPQVVPGIVVQAAEQLGVHAGDAGRRFAQAFAIGIFADGGQNLAHGASNARLIDVASGLALHERAFVKFGSQRFVGRVGRVRHKAHSGSKGPGHWILGSARRGGQAATVAAQLRKSMPGIALSFRVAAGRLGFRGMQRLEVLPTATRRPENHPRDRIRTCLSVPRIRRDLASFVRAGWPWTS